MRVQAIRIPLYNNNVILDVIFKETNENEEVKKKSQRPFAWAGLCRLFDAKRSTAKPNKSVTVDRSDK